MGHDFEKITVGVTLSRYGATRDDEDDALWADLQARIEAIAAEPRYEPIRPQVL
jgi:hypothetical protein